MAVSSAASGFVTLEAYVGFTQTPTAELLKSKSHGPSKTALPSGEGLNSPDGTLDLGEAEAYAAGTSS